MQIALISNNVFFLNACDWICLVGRFSLNCTSKKFCSRSIQFYENGIFDRRIGHQKMVAPTWGLLRSHVYCPTERPCGPTHVLPRDKITWGPHGLPIWGPPSGPALPHMGHTASFRGPMISKRVPLAIYLGTQSALGPRALHLGPLLCQWYYMAHELGQGPRWLVTQITLYQ